MQLCLSVRLACFQRFGQLLVIVAACFFIIGITQARPAVDVTVQGKISDRKGEALVGVNVVIKGSSRGATSDAAGRYSISVPDEKAVLVFSFVGYAAQEITVGTRTTLNVSLVEDNQSLDEVVVTGLFDQRSRMEASVAISTLNTKQIERVAATSAADLLKNIPGVYVNQARGEIWNTVYSRGISAGSIDNASGYYYVSMQEDGLPVTNLNQDVDSYLRTDASTARVEAVWGGSASILGANAPGGIFNYITKTGGKTLTGEVRAKYGLEGDGKNPYYRADLNIGGPINAAKDLTFNIGGFYRNSNGARYPGYAMNNGGQVRANVLKTYAIGSLKLYAKLLNDRNAVSEFIPTQGWDNPQIPAGFSTTDSYYLPNVTLQIPINQNRTDTFRSKDKFHAKEFTAGLSWVQDLGKGFTLKNDGRYSVKSMSQNVPAVVTPFATDGLLFYAIPHNLGKFGTYTFKDCVTGQQSGTVTQLPNIINGNFAGFRFIPGETNNFPGANVQKNSLFFLPLFYSQSDRSEFTDQFSITKKLDLMSFTLGSFVSSASLDIVGVSNDVGIGVGTMQDRPHLTDITLTGLDGKTYQVTDPNGFMDVGRDGQGVAQVTQNQMALFFGHDWQITPALNFDWGVRYESVTVKGFNSVGVPNPRRSDPTYGGRDGNPLTLYDNGGGTEGPHLNYDKGLSTFSFSGGLNYRLDDKQAVYVRYSNGNKSPDINFFIEQNTPFTLANTPTVAQKVEQLEAGYKVSSQRIKLFITPFYSILSNVSDSQTFTNADGSNYNPGMQFAKYTTTGVELEATYAITPQLSVRAGATFQGSKATRRKKLGFKGIINSDTGPIDMMPWGVEKLTLHQRYQKAIDAGVDIFSGTADPTILLETVKQGLVSEARINESVRRLLIEKFDLGLFENPYIDAEKAPQIVGNADFQKQADLAQRKSIVLLRNEAKLLPLKPGTKVYVETYYDNGRGNSPIKVSKPTGLSNSLVFVSTKEEADVVLLWLISNVGGLFSTTGKPIELSLSKNRIDIDYVNELLKSKPTILAINFSSPWVLDELDGSAAKTMLATLGTTAKALTDVVSGAFKPTGKLPFTIPVSEKAVADNKSDVPGHSEGNGYALFKFGAGLSY